MEGGWKRNLVRVKRWDCNYQAGIKRTRKTDSELLMSLLWLTQFSLFRWNDGVCLCVLHWGNMSKVSLSLSGLTAWLMTNVPPFCTPVFINTPSRYSDSHSSSVHTLTHSHTPLQHLHSWIPAWKITTVALHAAELQEWCWPHRGLLRRL